MGYAKKTQVPVDRSMGQIRAILHKLGVGGIQVTEVGRVHALSFIFEGRPYSFRITVPDINSPDMKYTSSGKLRTPAQVQQEIDSETRRLWRCMVLYVKAAIEAHNNGLVALSSSLLSHMITPSGKTVSELVSDDVARFSASPSLMFLGEEE